MFWYFNLVNQSQRTKGMVQGPINQQGKHKSGSWETWWDVCCTSGRAKGGHSHLKGRWKA